MNIWRIVKIPKFEKEVREGAVQDVQLFLKSVLYLLGESIYPTSNSIELVFFRKEKATVDIYMLLYGDRNIGISNVLEQQLATNNYQFQKLNTGEIDELMNNLITCVCSDIHAIIKTEKIVTTPYTYEGYYYWADSLRYDEKVPFDNFDIIFQSLLNMPYTYVSFHLFPTKLENYEFDTMQRLGMFLELHMHAFPNQFSQMYEPYAEAAYLTYKHFVDSFNQPVFMYNIVVGSASENGKLLADTLMAVLKSQTLNSCDLQNVKMNTQYVRRFDYEQFHFVITDLLINQYRDMMIWGGNIAPPNHLFRLPFLVTLDEAMGFFHLPIDNGKIVGIGSSSYEMSNELLDERVMREDNIRFGTILGKNIIIGASPKDLSKHVLIVGMPGTGKTTFSINLLMQFYKKGIPFLAIEPTKAEYRAMIDAIPDLQIFTPGNNEVSPFVMNPFLPPEGIKIEKFIPSLYSAFRAAFSMPSPLDTLFLKAIQKAYMQYGWKDYSKLGDAEVTVFGLQEFIKVFKRIIAETDYGKEVKGNLESGGILRLSNLVEQNRNIFDTQHSVPIVDMLSKPTVIELNAINNSEQKSLIMALLLINVCAHIKNNQIGDGKIKNAVMIDEAHVLLSQKSVVSENSPDMQNSAIQSVENMIAEVRSYGTAVIIADQRPSAVGEAIVANTDVKIAFRLTENRERRIIADSSCMTEIMEKQLAQLSIGQAYVYYNRLMNPQLVQTPDIRKNENIRLSVSDYEVQQRNKYWVQHQELLKPYRECKNCKNNSCNFKMRSDANYYMNIVWNAKHREIIDSKKLLLMTNGIPVLLESYLNKYTKEYREKLIICIRIMLLRKADFDKNLTIGSKQKAELLESAEIRKGENNGQ